MTDLDDYEKLRFAAREASETLRDYSLGFSPFLDEWGVSIYISELKAAGGFHWADSGGIAGASRRIVTFSSHGVTGVDEIPFIFLNLKPVTGLTRPPIQDALEALNEAGFSKERDVGEIFGEENGYLAVVIDRKGILTPTVTQIENRGFVIEKVDKSRLDKWSKVPSATELTVASLRLDAVLSSCTNLSRSKAKKLIEAGLVMVDYTLISKAERAVEEGNIISAKGKRRVVIEEIEGPTKKGKYRINYTHFA
jgi:RNA-binding protein YlmH